MGKCVFFKWRNKNVHEVAEAVHNEWPGSNQGDAIRWVLSQKDIEMDYDIVPFRSKRDFIGLQLRFADLNTWATYAVGPACFSMKWHVGRPRPEELAWQIATGKLTTRDGVPPDLVKKIKSMNLHDPHEFTAYPEGCPTHPAWPAMHAASSVASLWLAVVMKLTPNQYCEVLRMDYAVAYGRTVAGVHYHSDNIAGLNLGKEIMRKKLAGHMEDKYGSDRKKVQAKIERLIFDWNHFDPYDCSIAGDRTRFHKWSS